MPYKPQGRCTYPGCGARADGRCAAHAHKTNHTKTTAERGYGYQHRKMAQMCIEDQPWCTWCSSDQDLVADHIVAGKPEYGYQTLCRSCNSIKRNEERKTRLHKVRWDD